MNGRIGFNCRAVILTDNQRTILDNYLESFSVKCYGIETNPLVWHAEDPCLCGIKKIKSDEFEMRNLFGDGSSTKIRIHTAAFIRGYGMLPLPEFQISHLCGRGRCMEVRHFEVASQALNNQRKTCHGAIQDGIDAMERLGISVEERTGTFYWKYCPHTTTPCFKQFGLWML